MVAALWAAGHSNCPLVVNLDGHGNPTRADQYAGLEQHDRARAHQVLQSCLAPMAATLTEHLRDVMRSVDDLDLFEVYRQARCRLVIVSGGGVHGRAAACAGAATLEGLRAVGAAAAGPGRLRQIRP